jgi:hypothetical protein
VCPITSPAAYSLHMKQQQTSSTHSAIVLVSERNMRLFIGNYGLLVEASTCTPPLSS